jgi:hypothetical protein
VAVVAIDEDTLSHTLAFQAFTPRHLARTGDPVVIGCTTVVVGFPLGFLDTLHHMPVVRRAALASYVSRGRAISSPMHARTAVPAMLVDRQ